MFAPHNIWLHRTYGNAKYMRRQERGRYNQRFVSGWDTPDASGAGEAPGRESGVATRRFCIWTKRPGQSSRPYAKRANPLRGVSPSAGDSSPLSLPTPVTFHKRFRRGARGSRLGDPSRRNDLFPRYCANIPKDIDAAYGKPGEKRTLAFRPALDFSEENPTAAEGCLS